MSHLKKPGGALGQVDVNDLADSGGIVGPGKGTDSDDVIYDTTLTCHRQHPGSWSFAGYAR